MKMAVVVMQTVKFNKLKLTFCKFLGIVKQIHHNFGNKLSQESKELDLTNVTEDVYYEGEVDKSVEHDEIMKKRNKSRLRMYHQNIVHGRPPYCESYIPYHDTVQYKRKLFGRYGAKSGADPSILWPSQDELREKTEYERIAYPDTLQQMVARHKQKVLEEYEQRKKRENEINLKYAKLVQWKAEVEQRAEKKLMEAQAAKERKERLIEEVRRYFGFKVDPRDDRFKEMLEQKEKEESKKAKAERKKAKQAKLLAKLVGTESPPVQTQSTVEHK